MHSFKKSCICSSASLNLSHTSSLNVRHLSTVCCKNSHDQRNVHTWFCADWCRWQRRTYPCCNCGIHCFQLLHIPVSTSCANVLLSTVLKCSSLPSIPALVK